MDLYKVLKVNVFILVFFVVYIFIVMCKKNSLPWNVESVVVPVHVNLNGKKYNVHRQDTLNDSGSIILKKVFYSKKKGR